MRLHSFLQFEYEIFWLHFAAFLFHQPVNSARLLCEHGSGKSCELRGKWIIIYNIDIQDLIQRNSICFHCLFLFHGFSHCSYYFQLVDEATRAHMNLPGLEALPRIL